MVFYPLAIRPSVRAQIDEARAVSKIYIGYDATGRPKRVLSARLEEQCSTVDSILRHKAMPISKITFQKTGCRVGGTVGRAMAGFASVAADGDHGRDGGAAAAAFGKRDETLGETLARMQSGQTLGEHIVSRSRSHRQLSDGGARPPTHGQQQQPPRGSIRPPTSRSRSRSSTRSTRAAAAASAAASPAKKAPASSSSATSPSECSFSSSSSDLLAADMFDPSQDCQAATASLAPPRPVTMAACDAAQVAKSILKVPTQAQSVRQRHQTSAGADNTSAAFDQEEAARCRSRRLRLLAVDRTSSYDRASPSRRRGVGLVSVGGQSAHVPSSITVVSSQSGRHGAATGMHAATGSSTHPNHNAGRNESMDGTLWRGRSMLSSSASRVPPSCRRTAASDANDEDERAKKVAFDTVQIRTYSTILGDHPACSDGPPLSLGWSYDRRLRVCSVDAFESGRAPCRCTGMDDAERLALSRAERRSILRDRLGYSERELREAEHCKFYRQMEREETLHGLKYDALVERVQEVGGSSVRSIRRMRLFATSCRKASPAA